MNAVTTVADLIRYDMGLSLRCRDCRHGATLDLTKLPPAAAFRDLPFTCSKCNSRNVATTIHGSGTLRITGKL